MIENLFPLKLNKQSLFVTSILLLISYAYAVSSAKNIYPTNPWPVKTILVVNSSCFNSDESILIQSFQGMVNRESNNGFMIYRDCGLSYSNFIQEYQQTNDPTVQINSFSKCQDQDLVSIIANGLAQLNLNQKQNIPLGFFQLCTSNADGLNSFFNVAISYASSSEMPAFIIPSSLVNKLLSDERIKPFNLTQIYSFECNSNITESVIFDPQHTVPWSNRPYSSNILIIQKPSSSASALLDYAIYARAASIYNESFFTNAFSQRTPGSMVVGWGPDEFNTVATLSQYGLSINAADWACSISLLTNLNVTAEANPSTNLLLNEPQSDKVHTVTFLMTDGDNIQWLLNDFSTSENWFGNPNRTNYPLGFTLSPSLISLAPSVFSLYNNEKYNSEFVAAPSGLGYYFPDHLNLNLKDQVSDSILENTLYYMDQTKLSILNMIGDKFDLNKVQSLVSADTDNILSGIFYYPYGNNYCLDGSIHWATRSTSDNNNNSNADTNPVPVITAGNGMALWAGVNTPQQLADKLNKASLDPSSASGYSLIPVHVWSMTVKDVISTISLLNENVHVVAPSQFVNLIKQNIKP